MTGIMSLTKIARELSDDIKERMEEPFTLAEIEHAIDMVWRSIKLLVRWPFCRVLSNI